MLEGKSSEEIKEILDREKKIWDLVVTLREIKPIVSRDIRGIKGVQYTILRVKEDQLAGYLSVSGKAMLSLDYFYHSVEGEDSSFSLKEGMVPELNTGVIEQVNILLRQLFIGNSKEDNPTFRIGEKRNLDYYSEDGTQIVSDEEQKAREVRLSAIMGDLIDSLKEDKQ
jgi:hypothetical protein